MRPCSSASSSAPTSSRRQPAQGPHVGLGGLRAPGDRRSPAGRRGRRPARRPVPRPGLAPARAPRTARPAARRCVERRRRVPLVHLDRGAARPRWTAAITSSPRRRTPPWCTPRICSSSRRLLGRRLATSTSAASARMTARGGPGARLSARATRRARARPRALGPQGAHAGQAGEDHLGGRARRSTSRGPGTPARPVQAAAGLQAALELLGQLEQVHDVLAGVGSARGRAGARPSACSWRSWPRARRAPRTAASHRTPGRAGRRSRRRPGCRRVGDLGAETAAQERDVLAPGVHDHLDRGVGEHLRERQPSSSPSSGSTTSMRLGRRRRGRRAGPGTAACGSGPRP